MGVAHGKISRNIVEEHLDELSLLAETAGAEVAARIVQNLNRIHSKYFVGKGKAEQIINQAKEMGVKLIIFDEDLTPAQVKNYSGLANNIKVIDRSALILDIFRQHAKTRESKTQVELAYLQYLLPRLTRQWTHLERQMGGIGTRAGMGETQIEVDRRLIRTKISKLKKDLDSIEKERITQGQNRKSEFRAALVGYTNAGKSTLFKCLTGSDVFIQDQLFATLDTTVRRVNLSDAHSCLLSDTVGFIRKLPHHLVASFRSTLKEVLEADLLLIVVDMSSPFMKDHLDTIQSVLKELEADKLPQLLVLNKADLVSDATAIGESALAFPESVAISALESLRINQLKEKILEIMEKNFQTIEIEVSYKNGKIISDVQKGVVVLSREYLDTGVKLTIRGNRNRIEQIQAAALN
ncbi:MAG: GTPase HflX [Candidatus Marinimicrobia bacterium]|nr:GTPase HflX [Candidatus Neomarinimicrobiota bacterium]MDP6789365.1 GTPase HflX [Candidatus Neomarinimicrobiota bacterium]MDP7072733.1 GTPase HflX [Candidatus Neomarinimicrobiota bacterium]